MEITKDMVSYVAELSRLKLNDEQAETTRKGLGEIIGYMDILNNIDTEGVEPMSHALPLKTFSVRILLSQAPSAVSF